MTLVAIALMWVGCGAVAFGGTVADFWYEFPTLQSQPGRFRYLCGYATPFALIGPLGLIVVATCSGFFKHGLLFCQPETR
jgi:hypothetical protein